MNTDSTVFQGIIFCDETALKQAPAEVYRSTSGVKFGLACQTLKLTMASAKTESTLSVIYHSTRHLAHHLPVKQSKRQLQTHKASLTNFLRLYSRPHWFPSDAQYSFHHNCLSPKSNTNHSKVTKKAKKVV